VKILILGGYGVFGGRLARLLANCPTLTLLIGGRDAEKAQAFCQDFQGAALVVPLTVSRNDIAATLRSERPDVLVDASGPFQDYGANRYGVVEACIAAGVNYLDFADAADFVFDIRRFDNAAAEAGVFVLSGVSSFPVLTAAVLRAMAKDMTIERVEGGIAPSPFAGVGLNVMRAVVSYAGAPVQLVRDGRKDFGVGLAESRRYTIAVPGRMPLRNLRFSLVDVPDLQVLPPEHPDLQDIWMGAGPVPELLHRILNLLAKLRARLHLPSFMVFSRLFYFVLNLMKFGEHRGGMYVQVHGRSEGRPVSRSWHLLAEGDDGPLIPSMAIEGIIRKMLHGERPAPGARAAVRSLELADYQQLFAGRAISTGFRERAPGGPLFHRLLGSAFDNLPPLVRRAHDGTGPAIWSGTATITRSLNPLAHLVALLFGFPRAGTDVPITVRFDRDDTGEIWTRRFAERRFTSVLSEGSGRDQHLLIEQFGPARFALALTIEGDQLHFIPRSWSLLGIPMPRFLMPHGTSFETVRDDKFAFDIEIRLPLIGLVVAYRGTLVPQFAQGEFDA
jgi:hypothetical protein